MQARKNSGKEKSLSLIYLCKVIYYIYLLLLYLVRIGKDKSKIKFQLCQKHGKVMAKYGILGKDKYYQTMQ